MSTSELNSNFNPEERVDRTLDVLRNMGKDPFIEAIRLNEQQKLKQGDPRFDANLVKGAGNLLTLIEGLSPDEDFESIAQVKVLTALYSQLGLIHSETQEDKE